VGVGPELRISEARDREALAIRALHRSVLEEGRWFIRTPDELPRLDEVEEGLERYRVSENSAWFVARLPRHPCAGFLAVTGGALQRTRHAAHFEVMVDRGLRRRGVGARLLDHAVQWARDNPMLSRLSLSVYADNEGAIRLYRSRGFSQEGRAHGAFRESDGHTRDAVQMAMEV